MTKEEKKELLIDLAARIPYGVKIEIQYAWYGETKTEAATVYGIYEDKVSYSCLAGEEELPISLVKPYLRSFDSLTAEEKEELFSIYYNIHWIYYTNVIELNDWINSHHFDYRGLITKGLALEMSEEMYQNILKNRKNYDTRKKERVN